MLFNQFLFGFIFLSLILAHPLIERREENNNGRVLARAIKIPTKAIAQAIAKPLAKPAAPPRPPAKAPAKPAAPPRPPAKPAAPARPPAKPAAPARPPAKAPAKPAAAPPRPPAKPAAPARPPAKAPSKAAAAPARPPAKAPVKAAGPPPKGGSKTPPGIQLYTGNSPEDQARKANLAPGRQIPKGCKKLSDCSCPKGQSTSCINGSCSCNNAGANFFAKEFVNAAKAIGESKVVQGVGQTFKVLSDIKQVAGTVVGTFLGPAGKIALKTALNVIPDTGPSHLDDLTNGIAGKIL
jgi:hypothetical protein